MDKPTDEDIRHRLHRYDRAVQETRDHASEFSSFGRYRAGAPYFEQYPLRELLSFAGSNATFTEALALYGRITRELEAVERTGGRAYREELFCDLSRYTEAYRSLLCYHELGMHGTGGFTGCGVREEIGILLLELRKDFSLADIEREVAHLDEAHRIICEAGSPVQQAQELPDRSTGTSAPGWQQCPPSNRQKERAGFR
jgi:hypothetical protein